MRPQPGEVWFVDFGLAAKARWAMVLAAPADGRLALAAVVKITGEFAGTPYEVTLPHVPWLKAQSYVNAQSLQPVKFTELQRKAPGKFDPSVLAEVRQAVKRWLQL